MKTIFSDFLFPKNCLVCGKSGSYLCKLCQLSLPRKEAQNCVVCRRFSSFGKTHRFCRERSFLDGLICLFSYQAETKKIIRGLKQDLIKDSCEEICLFLSKEIIALHPFKVWKKANFVFVPVPLHRARKKWRGFNQSGLILENVCKKLNLDYQDDLLVRVRATKDQTKLGAKQRRRNMKGAFRIKNSKNDFVAGKNFLVFDDVKTTGATLDQAAKALKKSGARSVWGLALAG